MTVIADPAGRLIWASAALPGSTHNLIAARTHGITCALTSADVMTFADMGYQGAGGSVRTRVQAAPAPAPPAEVGQPVPRPDPRPRRASDRHPQDLDDPRQGALLPPPRRRRDQQ